MAPRVLLLYVANSSVRSFSSSDQRTYTYATSQQSGGFSGLFAYAVSFANGRLAGWQVLFILEGLLTVALGAAVYFILPDWPHVSSSLWCRVLDLGLVI